MSQTLVRIFFVIAVVVLVAELDVRLQVAEKPTEDRSALALYRGGGSFALPALLLLDLYGFHDDVLVGLPLDFVTFNLDDIKVFSPLIHGLRAEGNGQGRVLKKLVFLESEDQLERLLVSR